MNHEYETYLDSIDEIEGRRSDDSKFPVIEDGKIKMLDATKNKT